MRNRMTTRTRNRMLLGVSIAALLYVGLSVAFGDRITPLHNALGEAFRDLGLAIGEGVVRSALWITEFDGPQVLVLLGIAWALREIIPVARRNRHKLPSMPAINGRRVGAISGISLGAVAVIVALSFGSVALADGRPMVNSAYDASERRIGDLVNELPWNDKDETKAAPATSAAPTGNTGDEPVETASPAPAQPEDERTEEPKDRTDATTGDKRTETPAETRTETSDDKPVTDAFEGVLSHGDRIVNDPVKWMDENPLKALGLCLFLLMWMLWSLLKWRQNMLMRRELVSLRGRVNTHGNYLKDDDRRLTELESKKLRRGNSPDTLVAGGSTD